MARNIEIVDAIQRGNLVLFIGGGLSVSAGLPSWIALTQPLAAAVDYKIPSSDELITPEHLLATTQYYANQHGPNNLIQYLRDALDTYMKSPTALHYLLASLPIRTIFTTNYDDLIERSLRDSGKRPNVIVSSTDLAFWSEEAIQVVKLCGDLSRPESIVITRQDFTTYFANHARIVERLRTTLESKTILFLGYSLNDPFFNQIWDSINFDLNRYRRRGYAVLFNVSPLQEQDFHQRGIQVINIHAENTDEKTALLTEWLRQLLADVGQLDVSSVQIPTTIEELHAIRKQLHRMESKQDSQLTQLADLKRGQASIYHHISSSNQQVVLNVQTAIKQGRIEQVTMEHTIEAIRQAVKELLQHSKLLDEQVRSVLRQTERVVESDLEVRHKLEATIPLIPFLLDYKVEFGVGSQVGMEALWDELKKKLGSD